MLATFGQSLAAAALAVLWFMLILYIIALIRRDNSIVDIGWGFAFIIAVFAVLWKRDVVVGRQIIATTLVTVWGLRLGMHIFLRYWNRGRDWRYADRHFFSAFFQVFMTQGFLALVIVLPALYINTFRGPMLGWLDWLGVAVWAFGFFWEAISDYQLTRFLQGPAHRGRVMRAGLWRYSRHPNYFGEVTQWWGMWLLALSIPGAWITVIGPLVITFLIMKVSGIPLLESKYRQNPSYRYYMRHTNALVPWVPKR